MAAPRGSRCRWRRTGCATGLLGRMGNRMQLDQLRRREFITLLGSAAALRPLPLGAQQPSRTFQVGFLYPGPQAAARPRIAAFSSGLQAGGVRPEQVTII